MMFLVPTALAAGYGVPVDGYPSLVERQLVLWTNAARVAPTEFTSEYEAGGCSLADFSEDEQTAKAPLYVDLALTEVARAHSIDMAQNGCFQHESCDGTDTWTRIGDYYTETSNLGENIAMGSTDPKYAVMSMWMCSHSGHRANIMSGGFDEMGGGVEQSYMTQDFAGGGVLPDGDPPVRVATDYNGSVYADWGAETGPDTLELWTDGESADLVLANGSEDNGLYYVNAPEDGTPWRLHWTLPSGLEGVYPEEGSLVVGSDAPSDALPGGPAADAGGGDELTIGGCGGGVEAEPADDEADPSKDAGSDDLSAGGCAIAPGPASALAALLGALLLRRRR